MTEPVARRRIAFTAADASRFNDLRDQWRSAASSRDLSKAGLRIASVLPGFLSREFGYAFPTDEDLGNAIGANEKTAKRGLSALDDAALIERQTMVKRDAKGEAIGRLRRIYLTLPEVKGQEVKGQPEVKGQKRRGEGTYGCPNIPDRITPDNSNGQGERKVSAYVPARESVPSVFGQDIEFLDAFDLHLIRLTDGKDIGAGEIERITREAFDQATDSSPDFMPFHWAEVCALRSSETAEWFRQRAGALVHRRAAA